jgi:hypothetical protein
MKINPRLLSQTTTILLFIFVLWFLLIPIRTPFSIYDEGLVVFNSTRIMKGDIPYKDFWTLYPPGQYFALASIFRLFGTSLLISRIYDTFTRFIIVISVYMIAKKITTRGLSLLVCIVTTLLLSSAGTYTYVFFPSLAFGFLAILSLLKNFDTGQYRWIILTGILIGFSTLFRWDIGLYTYISVVLTIIPFHYICIVQESKNHAKAFFAISKIFVMMSGTILIVTLPCYGYWGFTSGFGNLLEQVVIFPITKLHSLRELPSPNLIPSIITHSKSISTFIIAFIEFQKWLLFFFPVIVYILVFSYHCFSIVRKHINKKIHIFGTTALAILGILLFTQALNRYDYIHVVPSSIIAFLLFIPLVHHFIVKINNLLIKFFFCVLLITLSIVYFSLPILRIKSYMDNYSPLECYSRLDRADCVYISPDQEQAVEFIRLHTLDGETIFVGNQRHDQIFINDIGFYFLSNRPSATKYHELFPGIATSREIQELIVNEIESKKVNWIVLVNFPVSEEPNASSVSSGVFFLDDFIRSQYVQFVKYGSYEIWKLIPK